MPALRLICDGRLLPLRAVPGGLLPCRPLVQAQSFAARFRQLDAFNKAEDPDVMLLKTTSGAAGVDARLACAVGPPCAAAPTGVGAHPQRCLLGVAWPALPFPLTPLPRAPAGTRPALHLRYYVVP